MVVFDLLSQKTFAETPDFLAVPEMGNIRLLLVTDRQFVKMEVIAARTKVPVEQPLPQVLLF